MGVGPGRISGQAGTEVGSDWGLFHRVGKLESFAGTAKHKRLEQKDIMLSVCNSEFKTDGIA
jgi:hypothetical protein